MKTRLYCYAGFSLPFATMLAGALLFQTSTFASQLDPLDPYQYTAGQFPMTAQNFGLPPQYSGQESMGMRQARFAEGIGDSQKATAISNGSVVIVTTTITTPQVQLSPAAVAAGPGTFAALDNMPYNARASLSIYRVREELSSQQIDRQMERAAQFAGDQTGERRATAEVESTRAKLDADFTAAQSATPENWSQVRATLAADYRAYTSAVANAQSSGVAR